MMVLLGQKKGNGTMAANNVRNSRKLAGRTKEDLHVRIAERTETPDTTPGESGRYVYGIVQAKDHTNFGKIGIGGAGELVYTVNYMDIAAVVSKTSLAIFG